jgi:hypothetical protein
LEQYNRACTCDQLSERVAQLEEQLQEVTRRNSRVERDKAWEISYARMASVALTTYITMVLVLYALGAGRPIRDAIIPTAGFLLSTLSLPCIRRVWESFHRNK